MTAAQYRKLSAPFRTRAWILALKLVNGTITLGMLFAYLGLLAALALQRSDRLVPILVIPALFLVVITLLRALLDAPRPYEALDIEPLLVRRKSGKSMPSRHVASAAVIAMAFLSECGVWSVPLFVCCALLGFVRVVGGIHFPADVLLGGGLGLLAGGLFFV